MNSNNQHMFDELVRQKLEDYSESPDMQLLQQIHTKKSRILKWYGMYRILIIATTLGLGILGSYYAVITVQEASKSGKVKTEIAQHVVNSESTASNESTDLTPTPFDGNTETSVNSRADYNQSSGNGLTRNNSSVNSSYKQQVSTSTIASSNHSLSKTKTVGQDAHLMPKGQSQQAITQTTSKTEQTNCTSAFNYFVSFNGEFNFTNFSKGDAPLTYRWDFGDGMVSNQSAPLHTYQSNGTYIVKLTASDQNGCSQTETKEITYSKATKSNAVRSSLKGVVKAGNTPMANALVELYPVNNNGSEGYYAIKTNNNGEFLIKELTIGKYLLRASPNDENSGYVKTFWGNETDANTAPEVIVTNNYDEQLIGFSIDLAYKAVVVTGNKNTLEGNNNSDHPILLLDANNNIVGHGTMDANGKINYNGELTGNFKVMDKQTGAITGDVNLGSDPNSSNSKGVIHEAENTATMTLTPNPAVSSVNLNLQSLNGEAARVMIMDGNGKEMFSTDVTVGLGSSQIPINISSLPGGIYYVLVMMKNGDVISNRLMKSDTIDR